MNEAYKILFSVNLLCEYYKQERGEDLELFPSPETARLFKKHRMISRFSDGKLFVLIQVDQDDRPFISLDSDQSLVFYLQMKQDDFMNLSNINLEQVRYKRFYFSNISSNEVENKLYLSLPIQQYDDTAPYLPGDFVQVGSIVYECIRSSSGEQPASDSVYWRSKVPEEPSLTVPEYDNGAQYQLGDKVKQGDSLFECIKANSGEYDTSNGVYWKSLPPRAYVSSNDLLSFIEPIHTFYTSSEATTFTVKAVGLNKSTGNYDLEVPLKQTLVVTDEPADHVQLNLSHLHPGRYHLTINGEEFKVYINGPAGKAQLLGVVEIFMHLSSPNPFALLDEQGKVKDKKNGETSQWLTYFLIYANRLAYWKYIPTRKTVSAIKDATLTFSFAQNPVQPAVPEYFISEQPIPLAEKPLIFEVKRSGLVENCPPKAPNPDPKKGGILQRINGDYQFTIYLNY